MIRPPLIVDLESGRVIVNYPIDTSAQDDPHSEWEMMERAWCYAVEDGITRSDARSQFTVRMKTEKDRSNLVAVMLVAYSEEVYRKFLIVTLKL